MNLNANVMIIDDDESTHLIVSAFLKKLNYQVSNAFDLDQAKCILKTKKFIIIILDLELKNESGLEGMAAFRECAPTAKIFVLTAYATISRAVLAIQEGASDYFVKGGDLTQLANAMAHIAKLDSDLIETMSLSRRLELKMIGVSLEFQTICKRIMQLKDVDSTILLLGESGTGKEVAAKTLHSLSNRCSQRFDAINCAAIPESLLESELFGHRRGAFTDARADRKGIFELCHKGTLLLDEIGDMPLNLQAKLLRVLQEKLVTPLGSSQSVNIDTRVIAATHKDLYAEMVAGRFREDLYYRLSVIPLTLPPLRERKADIPILLASFLQEFNQRFGRGIQPPSAVTLKRLMEYSWPGNIRELRNTVERSVILSEGNSFQLEELFEQESGRSASAALGERQGALAPLSLPLGVDANLFRLELSEAKQVFEKIYLETQLRSTHGNVSEASKKSGRYRADIYRLMNRYDLQAEQFR